MKKSTMALFFSLMFLFGTDTFIVSPLLPTLHIKFHVAPPILGWAIAAYTLGYSITALIAGPLSDEVNRKLLLITGLIGFACSNMVCALAPTYFVLVAARFVAGVSAACATPQVWAAISILSKGPKMIRNMGIATAGLAVSQAVGVPLGSLLSKNAWFLPFILLAAGTLGLLGICVWLYPNLPGTGRAPSMRPILGRYGTIWSTFSAVLTLAAYFLFQMGNFGRFSYIGLWLGDHYHLNTQQIGLIMLWFGVGNLVGSLLGGTITEKITPSRALGIGLFLVTGVAIYVPLAAELWEVCVSLFMTALAFGVMFPIMMYRLQHLSTAASGTIASLSNALMYFGATLGTNLSGVLYTKFGFFSISLFSAVMFVCAWIGFYIGSRQQQTQRSVTAIKEATGGRCTQGFTRPSAQ